LLGAAEPKSVKLKARCALVVGLLSSEHFVGIRKNFSERAVRAFPFACAIGAPEVRLKTAMPGVRPNALSPHHLRFVSLVPWAPGQ
jgi:hypothetical protein